MKCVLQAYLCLLLLSKALDNNQLQVVAMQFFLTLYLFKVILKCVDEFLLIKEDQSLILYDQSKKNRLMNGYVSLSAHPSYPRTHITSFFFLNFIPEFGPESYFSIKARKQGNNKEIINGRHNLWSLTSFYEWVILLPITWYNDVLLIDQRKKTRK